MGIFKKGGTLYEEKKSSPYTCICIMCSHADRITGSVRWKGQRKHRKYR